MDDISRIFIFPIPGREQIMWAILIILGFFLLAIFIEILRRRNVRGLRLAAEWRAIDQIFEEKGFGGDEKKITKGIVARHAGFEPLRAVTVRHAFNRCVEEHLRDFERVTDAAGLAKR